MKKTAAFLLLFSLITRTYSQSSIHYNEGALNNNTSEVPFLLIPPDARAGGMGNLGVASSPDGNSVHWNASKLAFINKEMGLTFSYSPWFNYSARTGVFHIYGSLYKRISNGIYMAASLRYFQLGNLQLTDNKGNGIGLYLPKESAFDIAFAKKLGNNFSAAVAARYIYSNLTSSIPLPSGISTHIGRAWAGDISLYYSKKITLSINNAEIAAGLNISNVGTRISYTDDNHNGQIPTQARIGASLKLHLDESNSIAFLSDVTRLLVSTLPYQNIQNEIKNLNEALGIEYSYNNAFMLRGGYSHQDSSHSNQQFFTLGLGCRYKLLQFDIAYFIPVLPVYTLQNTFRLTLTIDLSTLKRKETNNEESKN